MFWKVKFSSQIIKSYFSAGSRRKWRGVYIVSCLTLGTGLIACASVARCEHESVKLKMPFRMLGNTGIQVSVLGIGWGGTFGAKVDLRGRAGVDGAKMCMKRARELGVNLFDNAEGYGEPYGEGERILGIALKELQLEDPVLWKRGELIITTKIFFGSRDGVNEIGLSRKHIEEGLDASLERLQLKYVDLLYCHRPDPLTPTETIVRAMTDAVRSGRAKYWGTSEWSAQQITEGKFFLFPHDSFSPFFKPCGSLESTVWSLPCLSNLSTTCSPGRRSNRNMFLFSIQTTI
jgi:hypothetical protein